MLRLRSGASLARPPPRGNEKPSRQVKKRKPRRVSALRDTAAQRKNISKKLRPFAAGFITAPKNEEET
jgi:hypothetical protein